MRPFRSFLLLLIFLACFTGLHYAIPGDHLFPPAGELFPGFHHSDTVSSLNRKVESHKQPADSLLLKTVPVSSGTDSLPRESVKLAGDLFAGFLDSLKNPKGQLRIMYYGDSQLEGDRITSFLRQSLREGRGGTGPGLMLPLMPVMYTKTVWLRSSSNWGRYNYLSFKKGELQNPDLGPFLTMCRFLPEGVVTGQPEKAFVRIRPSSLADSCSKVYDLLRVFYGNANGKVSIKIKADDIEVYSDTLKQGRGLNELNCQLNGAGEVLIEFEGVVSPDIYGLSIESKSGVVVDNIPQRGSAGLEFTMVGKENLRESFKKLSPDLFILQYGLNVVKNITGDYSYYQKGLERQIQLLKEISPSTPVLVVGVTDMARTGADSLRSYSNIPDIIRSQKLAAELAGAEFWDSYKAMGGELSMISWAARKPPLGQKDYVHLTYDGADTLSKIMTQQVFTAKKTDTVGDHKVSAVAVTVTLPLPDTLSAPLVRRESEGVFPTILRSVFRYDPDSPMIFSVPSFWLFLLLVLAGYSLIGNRLFMRNAYLFLVSLFFYYKSGGLFLFLLILVTVVDFACGHLIYRSRTRFMRRFYILLSLVSNLGILAYFKYTVFFAGIINHVFGTNLQVHDFLAGFSNSFLGTSFDVSKILLPVGISFFTFQSLSYTIDVYRKKLEPVRNIIDFGFYVSFFPQLVAGPIVRASEFIPQLYSEFHLSKREFNHAVFLILKGLIKKVIISDFIALGFIDRVFDAPALYSGFENLMAVYGYGLQIYCDFSGYTDIAIGLGLILGFRLPLNFNSPYKARDISDFWKRWHISLSRWLKDYLYIPLGGSRKGKFRTNANLMITMLLGGLWHGADLRFIIWGALHGTGLVIDRLWKSLTGRMAGAGKAGTAIKVFITFQFVNFCWIFFRSSDMANAGIMIRQIFTGFSPGSYLTVIPAYGSVFLLILAGYFIHFLPETVKESFRGVFINVPAPARWAAVMIVAVLLYQMRTPDVTPFIYFRF
jgi:alginate O-acetyltransferase complex protein AlgI